MKKRSKKRALHTGVVATTTTLIEEAEQGSVLLRKVDTLLVNGTVGYLILYNERSGYLK